MLSYLAKRGVARIALLLAAAAAIFLLTRPLIGDAAPDAPLPSALAALLEEARARLGADVDVLGRFASWAAAILGGDLGRSAATGGAIADLLLLRLPVTLQLVASGLVLALAVALPLGLAAARHQGGRIDRAARALVALAEALPAAGLALVMVLVFAVLLRWLPASGHADAASAPTRWAMHMLLPATTLAVAVLTPQLRTIRDAIRAARADRYLVVARALGASDRSLFWGRALRLALAPVLAAAPALLGQALGLAVLIETIFDLPGLGRLVIESIVARDFVLLRNLALASAAAIVGAGLASDLLRGALDRRVRARVPA